MTDISETISETISQAQAVEKLEQKRPYPGRERIPFPQSGPDHFFLFSLNALGLIENTVTEVAGTDWRGTGVTFFGMAERLLQTGNIDMVKTAVDTGLKTTDATGKVIPVAGVDLDDIPWSIGEIVEAALDALAVAYFGKRYAIMLAEATQQREAFLRQIEGEGEVA